MKRLTHLAAELSTLVRSFLVDQPLEAFFPISLERNAQGPQDTAVVLIPGYLERPGAFLKLKQELKDAGFAVFLYRPEQFFSSVGYHTHKVCELVSEIKNTHGFKRIALIGHSMGGVIARHAAQSELKADDSLVAIATIASPNHGTIMSHLGIGQCVNELVPESDFLIALNSQYGELSHKTVCFQADFDLLVPTQSAQVKGATNIVVPNTGHMTILDCSAVSQTMARFISAC